MAPKDSFSKQQSDWICATFPDYIKKLGKCKPREAGRPEPKDDSDLGEWVDAQKDEFLKTFKSELEASTTSIRDWTAVSH